MTTGARHRYEGREEGPVQQVGEVVDRRRLGRYWGITITAGEIAKRSQPGQFVNVAVEGTGTILRRPFSIAGATASGPVAGTVDIVVDVHGPGTEVLGRARTGDRLTVMGPLGRPFPLPTRRVSALLVGGGYGAAPLYWLGDRLRAGGHKVGYLLGAASQHRLVDPIVPKRMATYTEFTTEDGSMGERGRVTDLLDKALATTGAEVVYACGPNGMLAAVSAVCHQREIPCQVAVEEHMACGVGVCMTCVLPIRDRHGTVHNRRVCTDGPVFTSTRIDWDQSRYAQPAPVPATLLQPGPLAVDPEASRVPEVVQVGAVGAASRPPEPSEPTPPVRRPDWLREDAADDADRDGEGGA